MAVVMIKGDDATLVAQAVRKVVTELVGPGDRTLMIDELSEGDYVDDDGQPAPTALVTAAYTPPFLTERRVVVGRNLGLFSRAAQVAPLVDLLGDLLPTTDLVLVWEKGSTSSRLAAIPKPLRQALTEAGAELIDAAPSGKGRRGLLGEKLAGAAVTLDRSAQQAIADRLGDDIGRADAVLAALHSAFGEGTPLSAADVDPYLGAASDVPPWELTDAIDSGDIVVSLAKLDRMTSGGERHGLQVMATLTAHYQRALGLDGAPVRDDRAAAAHLGMTGSTFPAKKALALSRRLGSGRLRQMTELLAQADLDLRGASAVPSDAVLQVLVARLARLSR
ncbi:MAG: DNA polymerase III subunit delta [Acidimicrobiales bacterium]